MWIAKHVSAFIPQIIPIQIGNLHSLLLNCDSKALLCSGHGRAGCGTASLLLSRVRCRGMLLVLKDSLRGLKWDICCLKVFA